MGGIYVMYVHCFGWMWVDVGCVGVGVLRRCLWIILGRCGSVVKYACDI